MKNFIINLFTKIKNIFLFRVDDAHEFSPILTEIEDSPINPLGPTIFWLIISFIFIACLWLYFGKVDVVITARGIIIPDGEEKVIQPLEKGIVSEILVKEGDSVKKGQTVVIITPAEHEPELEIQRLNEEANILHERIADARYQLQSARAKKNRLSNVLDIIPRSEYDEASERVVSLSHELNQYQASLSEIRTQKAQLEKQTQIIKSPVDGYVNELMIHTIGGVVTPAEKLVSIVPKTSKLKIKATVLNQDIGFVNQNMPVSVKVDTFNFQKYGILNGTVTTIAPNSIENENLGPVYEIYIKPENYTLMVEGKEQRIKAGMTTTNEIKTGKRRIIEFFIYPLIKYFDEGIKVR